MKAFELKREDYKSDQDYYKAQYESLKKEIEAREKVEHLKILRIREHCSFCPHQKQCPFKGPEDEKAALCTLIPSNLFFSPPVYKSFYTTIIPLQFPSVPGLINEFILNGHIGGELIHGQHKKVSAKKILIDTRYSPLINPQ